MTSSESTSSMRFHGLDTLRAIAILLVMLFHLNLQGMIPAVISPVAKVGWVGVDLFFVLSGFLIGSQLVKPYLTGGQPSLKDFYIRRLYRILPAFGVVVGLYFVLPLWREAPGPYAGWQYLTFTWNLLLLGYPEHRAFSHIWSLCVEQHFYLLFSLLLVLLMRKPSVWKAVSILLFLVLGGNRVEGMLTPFPGSSCGGPGRPHDDEIHLLPTYSRLDGLVVGISLALVRTFRIQWWSRIARRSGTLALVGIAMVLGGLWLCDFNYPDPDLPLSILFAFPALACGFGLLVASAVCEKGFLRARVPGASLLAALAFSLYLTHKSVAHATHVLLPTLTAEAGWQSFMIYVLTCLASAALLYTGVERPFIALRARQGPRAATDREVKLDPAI